jgi:hypothetical protein
MSLANQLALFESANAFDERAKQGGDVGSALVLLQIGVALKFSPLRLAKGELELIPPKSEKWREDVLMPSGWDARFTCLLLGRSRGRGKGGSDG